MWWDTSHSPCVKPLRGKGLVPQTGALALWVPHCQDLGPASSVPKGLRSWGPGALGFQIPEESWMSAAQGSTTSLVATQGLILW